MSIRHIPSARKLFPLAAALSLAVAAPAAAEEPTAMERFFGAIGLIETPKETPVYRERAPLVVPPSQALIPPRSADDIRNYNPDWPVDHDARAGKAAQEAVDASKRTDNSFYSGARIDQKELERGRISRAAAAQQRVPETPPAHNEWGRLSPSQLGFKGWGSKKEETVVFTGEPERRYLTEPPPGLRTPSTEAPYGVVTEKSAAQKRDPMQRPIQEGR